ncbi:hypothetical protein CRG98_005401 [Punica granatum]|uniref:Uncharacterized protein n=1 Tax=Punica granatum TaxID=22663 RepID=A0A2I0L0N7_PUNGR|nr:hypothetical protein CRG98_005401 [Punica granatum]
MSPVAEFTIATPARTYPWASESWAGLESRDAKLKKERTVETRRRPPPPSTRSGAHPKVADNLVGAVVTGVELPLPHNRPPLLKVKRKEVDQDCGGPILATITPIVVVVISMTNGDLGPQHPR